MDYFPDRKTDPPAIFRVRNELRLAQKIDAKLRPEFLLHPNITFDPNKVEGSSADEMISL
jgi:hypothetical protein